MSIARQTLPRRCWSFQLADASWLDPGSGAGMTGEVGFPHRESRQPLTSSSYRSHHSVMPDLIRHPARDVDRAEDSSSASPVSSARRRELAGSRLGGRDDGGAGMPVAAGMGGASPTMTARGGERRRSSPLYSPARCASASSSSSVSGRTSAVDVETGEKPKRW